MIDDFCFLHLPPVVQFESLRVPQCAAFTPARFLFKKGGHKILPVSINKLHLKLAF
jgi:hypothetical protein